MKKFNQQEQGWDAKEISNLSVPALLTGDSDLVQPEHTVEVFHLLGGGKPGDLSRCPKSQMAILPGTTHMALSDKADIVIPMIEQFLA